jgi:hypothetical protein
LDPTDHRDQTRNDGISRPWRKSSWLLQRYDDVAGRPRRVHSKKEEHNCGVVGTHSKKRKWQRRARERRWPVGPGGST